MTPEEIDIDKTMSALQHTQDRMQQLQSLISDLPAEDRHGKFLRIFELVDIIEQGLDTIENTIAGPETRLKDL